MLDGNIENVSGNWSIEAVSEVFTRASVIVESQYEGIGNMVVPRFIRPCKRMFFYL